jgi:diguanylate cyclase (GGDEF)-like protein
MLNFLRVWWSQSSHYTWLSTYLAARSLRGATRAMMTCISALMTVSLLALLCSPDGPEARVSVVMMGVAIAGGVFATGFWMVRWPTCGQSLCFATVSSASIALACLSEPDALPALFGCVAFAVTGGYLAFFHTMRWVLFNLVVAATVGGVAAARLIDSGHAALALVDLSLVLQVNLALPVAIQILVHLMGSDLVTADHDPLTGLLNRRAFDARVADAVASTKDPGAHLLVAVIDLDEFKKVNDTWGHPVGDAVLISVARALTGSAEGDFVARSGGEEFVVARLVASDDPGGFAQRLCDAVAALHGPVTASVGTAALPLSAAPGGAASLLRDLVGRADAAMYRAKRGGGNRCHHDGDEPTPIHLVV